MSKVVSNKWGKILLFVVLDIIAVICSAYMSLKIRFDLSVIPNEYFNNLINYIGIDIIIMLVVFIVFKLYLNMWSYASVSELLNIIAACFFTILIEFIYRSFMYSSLPRSYYLIKFILLLSFIIVIRFSYRFVKALFESRKVKKNKINTMIIGAGEASRLLISEIHSNPSSFKNKIICAIDDDKNKIGSYIRGIPVVGNRKSIHKFCDKFNISEIIIAIPSASRETIGYIVDECQKTKCTIKILPKMYEMIDNPTMNKVRELSYEDFLGRNEIVVDLNEISENIKNKIVLVTGGGGSIGSELCRQIAKCLPKKLIILDIYENNAYDIEQELRRDYPSLDLSTIIGSVRDYDRMEKIFKEYHPNQVYHAAAHKHVPLMEVSPNEAIKNNCLGTLNMVKLSDKYKIDKFVLVSTDKAVRPTNVMGASKRICEMIIQSYDKKSNTDFVAVRFGNVLGSNGSVIPLFLKQIENGGPVTVTHKEITRFFMTIPEAVSLILQASVYAHGGEIFVLDMGKPVKIYDLAKRIIRYKGFEPDVDIKIDIVGLRPGEKLYEEILMAEEGLRETPNKLIHIGSPIKFNESKFLDELDKLINYAYLNKDDIKYKVAKIVDTYKVDEGDKNGR